MCFKLSASFTTKKKTICKVFTGKTSNLLSNFSTAFAVGSKPEQTDQSRQVSAR